MRGITQKLFGHATDRKLAKELATEIALLIGSKRVANQRYVIGKPFCPYKVAMHNNEFWCTVFVSDTSYYFTANHKCPTEEVCSLQDLVIYVKTIPNYLGAPKCKRLANISAALRVPVYAPSYADESHIQKVVFSESIFGLLREIDFYSISKCHIAQLQFSATSSLQSPEHCVAQAKLYRELLVLLFKDSQERHENGSTSPTNDTKSN
jgi:hypothetical protein